MIMGASAPASLIRPAIADDVPAIHAMIRELAAFERLTHEVTGTAQDLYCALFGERPAAEAFVACAGDEAAGFALFFTSFSTFEGKPGIYLEDLYVRPQFRGRGLGKGLLLRVAEIALSRGCARYEWSVLEWNRDAIEFYRNFGAEMHADWRRMRVSGDGLRELAGLRKESHP